MGAIGRWIDQECRDKPDVMRRVLWRKFGQLDSFFDDDGKCGCLVGSWLLEQGFSRGKHNMQDRDSDIGVAVAQLCDWQAESHWDDAANLDKVNKRPDAQVIRLLKNRIRKSLGLAPATRSGTTEEEFEYVTADYHA